MFFRLLILMIIIQIRHFKGQDLGHWFTDLFNRPVPFPHSPGHVNFLIDMSKQSVREQTRAALFYPRLPMLLVKDDSIEGSRQIYNTSQQADAQGHPPTNYIMRVDDMGRTLFQGRVNWSVCSDASDVCQNDSHSCYGFMRDIMKPVPGKLMPKWPLAGEQLETYCIWTDMKSGARQCDFFNKSSCWRHPYDTKFYCILESNETVRDFCEALSRRRHVITVSKSNSPIRSSDSPCANRNSDHPTVRLKLDNRTLTIGSHHLFNGSMRFQVVCFPHPESGAHLEVCQFWSSKNRTRCKPVKCNEFVRIWRNVDDSPVLHRFEATIFDRKNRYRNIESYAYVYLIHLPKPKLTMKISSGYVTCTISNFGDQPHGIIRCAQFSLYSKEVSIIDCGIHLREIDQQPSKGRKQLDYHCLNNLVIYRRGSTPGSHNFHTSGKISLMRDYKITSFACRAKIRFRTCNPYVDHFSKLAIVYASTEGAAATLPIFNTTTTKQRRFDWTTTSPSTTSDYYYYDTWSTKKKVIVWSVVSGSGTLVVVIVGVVVVVIIRVRRRRKQEKAVDRKLSRKSKSRASRASRKTHKKAVTFVTDDRSISRSRQSIKSIQSARSSKRGGADGRKSRYSSSTGRPRADGKSSTCLVHGKSGRPKSRHGRRSLFRTSMGLSLDKKSLGRSSLARKSTTVPSLGKKSAASSLRKTP